jgi:hypothetical protein
MPSAGGAKPQGPEGATHEAGAFKDQAFKYAPKTAAAASEHTAAAAASDQQEPGTH